MQRRHSPTQTSQSQQQQRPLSMGGSSTPSAAPSTSGGGVAASSASNAAARPLHQSQLLTSGPLARVRPADVDGHRRAEAQAEAPGASSAGQASGVGRRRGSPTTVPPRGDGGGSSPTPSPASSSSSRPSTPTASSAGEPSGSERPAAATPGGVLRTPSVVSNRARSRSGDSVGSSLHRHQQSLRGTPLLVREDDRDYDHDSDDAEDALAAGKGGKDVAISIDVDSPNCTGGVKRASLLRSRSSPLSSPKPALVATPGSGGQVIRRTASGSATKLVRISTGSRQSDRLPLYRGESSSSSSPRFGHGAGSRTHHHHSVSHTVSVGSGHLAHITFLLFIFYVMLDSKAKVDRSAAQLQFYREEEARVNAKIVEFEARSRQLAVEVDRLRRDNEAMEELKRDREEKLARFQADKGMVAAIKEEQEKLKHRDSVIMEQVWALERRIQLESRREVIDKFGPGPHRVEVALDFPNQPRKDENGKLLPYKFHVEMASLDDMPHSVQLFLEQVHHGLWDGCAFVWNPSHLILASPHVHATPNEDGTLDIKTDDEKREDFVDTGYTSVSFQEYSPNAPHRQYTLGFAGRPGGPNFYVNMRDNSKVHGPDGQTANMDSEADGDADPCFGRVVAGFEAVDRMHGMPVKGVGEGWMRSAFQDNVFIKYAKILPAKA